MIENIISISLIALIVILCCCDKRKRRSRILRKRINKISYVIKLCNYKFLCFNTLNAGFIIEIVVEKPLEGLETKELPWYKCENVYINGSLAFKIHTLTSEFKYCSIVEFNPNRDQKEIMKITKDAYCEALKREKLHWEEFSAEQSAKIKSFYE